MAKYQKVEAFSPKRKYITCFYDDFSSVSDAITTILYHKFGLCYGTLSDFAGMIFHVVPEDDNIAGNDYTITSGGNIRFLK